MSSEGLVPCQPCWEKGSSLAQSWGRCFLPTAGVGLGDCTAAQENIWAPSASCHPLGWVWKCTGALQLPVRLIAPVSCEIRAGGCSTAALGTPRSRHWRRVPLFCVAALIPGPRQYLGTGSLWSVSPGWIKDGCLPQGMGGARLLTGTTGPVCSKLGHLVLPQVTSSKKSFLQGWRSLNPYYALTGIWHCLLEMDVRSWTHCNKGRTFFGCFCSHSDSETVINYLTDCQVSSELEHVHFLTM